MKLDRRTRYALSRVPSEARQAHALACLWAAIYARRQIELAAENGGEFVGPVLVGANCSGSLDSWPQEARAELRELLRKSARATDRAVCAMQDIGMRPQTIRNALAALDDQHCGRA